MISTNFEFNPLVWYKCKLCNCIFADCEELRVHKLEHHLGDCLKIKCIIFEEKLLDHEWTPSGSVQNIFLSESPFKSKTNHCGNSHQEEYKNPYVSLKQLKTTTTTSTTELNQRKKVANSVNQVKRNNDLIEAVPSFTRKIPKHDNSSKRLDQKPTQSIVSTTISELNPPINIPSNQISDVKVEMMFIEEEGHPEEEDPFAGLSFAEGIPNSSEDFPMPVILQSFSMHNPESSSVIITADITEQPTLSLSKPFVCRICLTSFSRRCYLQRHENSHSEVKPYKCPFCSVAFKCKNSLNRHLIVHGKVTANKCRFCSKNFHSMKEKGDHERTHTGEEPFKCPIPSCDRAFKSTNALFLHTRRTHSDELGLQKFVCPRCGRMFGLKYDLHMHTQRGHCTS